VIYTCTCVRGDNVVLSQADCDDVIIFYENSARDVKIIHTSSALKILFSLKRKGETSDMKLRVL